ncbi:MAG: VWA domain-containing protein [Anaerolineae bacterium]
MNHDSDYYAILGVEPQATTEVIREAFTRQVANFPKGADSLVDDPVYQRLLQAYQVLSDRERRATYDSLMAEAAAPDLTITVEASRTQLQVSKSAQAVYLLVDVKLRDAESRTRLPLNLCLVIDRSTSMQGARLDRVKSGVEMIIEKLAPDDVMSAVTFSDRAEVILPARRISNKKAVMAQIRSILASGGTEIYQGLAAGMQEIRQAPLEQYNSHLILLTDGHTYGDEEECLLLSRQAAAQGVDFTAFGIGAEWNDRFLDQLVSPSGGHSNYVATAQQIIEYLQERVTDLGTVYARNVRLMANLHKSVTLLHGFKLSPFSQPLTVETGEIKLGNIEGNVPLSFLLKLSVGPQPVEARIKMPLTIKAQIPALKMKERTVKQTVELLVLSEAARAEPPRQLLKAVRMWNMYRMNEKVWEEVEAGRLELAVTRMHHLSTRLLEAGEAKLAQQAYMEKERLASMGTTTLEGRKRLKYGTRALITRTLNLDQNDEVS